MDGDDDDAVVIGERYRLLRKLGSGGMAEVWLAADLRLGDKRVAVKRLLGYRADGEQGALDVERARREALSASRLSHPNLVAVTDFVAENREPFIVMEYVEGVTLSDLIGEQGLGTRRAAHLIAQVASAVADAHEQRIVHRDIKPANILVTGRDVAKLADFGIARTLDDPRLTQTGYFTGTVGYLAPEVLSGADSSFASDVWALGVVLYEAVEGRPAFDGTTAPAIIAAIVLHELPVATSSPELAPLITRMMNRDPAQRPTMDEVATELRQVAARTEPVTRPVGADSTTDSNINSNIDSNTASGRETVVAPFTRPDPPKAAGGQQSGPPSSTPPPTPPPSPHAATSRPPTYGPTGGPGPGGPPPFLSGPASPARGGPTTPRKSRRRPWVIAAAVVVLAGAGTGGYVLTSGGSSPTPTAAGQSRSASTTGTSAAAPGPSASASASSTAATGSPAGTGFQVLAHRGGQESYAEETLPAFVDAATRGYAVETDIRWTSDGVPILVHDENTAAGMICTPSSYLVSKTTYATLKNNCHSPPSASKDGKVYGIPTVEDTVKALADIPGATLFAEIKTVQTPTQVRQLLSILERNGLIDRTVITSFKAGELAKMYAQAQRDGHHLMLLQFVQTTPTPVTTLAGEHLAYVAVEMHTASAAYLASLHTIGVKTVVFTVDTPTEWAAARTAKADYVLTDLPGAFLAWQRNQ